MRKGSFWPSTRGRAAGLPALLALADWAALLQPAAAQPQTAPQATGSSADTLFLADQRAHLCLLRAPALRARPVGRLRRLSNPVPVATHQPGEQHHLRIAYDRAAGQVHWYIDDQEVFHVDYLGDRIARQNTTLDHGGVEGLVSPRQLDCGMGLFTLLDGYRPANTGLVRLSSAPQFYFNPALGAPAPEPFVDNQGLLGSRLFGQGAAMQIQRYVVWH